MAVQPKRITVGTTVTRVSTPGYRSVLARNRGAVAVYLGGPQVTTSRGYQLDPDEALSIDLPDGDDVLYGVTASSTATMHVIEVG